MQKRLLLLLLTILIIAFTTTGCANTMTNPNLQEVDLLTLDNQKASNVVPEQSGVYQIINGQYYQLIEKYTIKNCPVIVNDFNIFFDMDINSNSPYQTEEKIEVKNAELKAYYDKKNNEYKRAAHIDKINKGDNVEIEVIKTFRNGGIKYITNLSNTTGNYSTFSEYTKYTSPEELIESNNPLVINTAHQIIGNETNPYKKAEKIFSYVNTNIEYNLSEKNKGALNCLTTKKGVCEDFAKLFVALCRASGVPARSVPGFAVESEKVSNQPLQCYPTPNYAHEWAEFYLPEYGWIIVDPTVIYTDKYGKRMVSTENFANGTEKRLHLIATYDSKSRWYYTARHDKNADLNIQTSAYILKK